MTASTNLGLSTRLYSLFTLRKPRSPSRINGERGFLRVNRLYDSVHQGEIETPFYTHTEVQPKLSFSQFTAHRCELWTNWMAPCVYGVCVWGGRTPLQASNHPFWFLFHSNMIQTRDDMWVRKTGYSQAIRQIYSWKGSVRICSKNASFLQEWNFSC